MKTLTNLQQSKYGVGFEVGNRYAFGMTNVGGQLWPAIYAKSTRSAGASAAASAAAH